MKLVISCFSAIIFFIFSGILLETGCVYANSVRKITVTKITNPASIDKFGFTLIGREEDDDDDNNDSWETIEPEKYLSNGGSYTWEIGDDDFEDFILTESFLPNGWFLKSITTDGGEDVELELNKNRVIFELDDDDNYGFTATFTNAVPIPSAVWLLGSGLVGIVGFRRKFKK